MPRAEVALITVIAAFVLVIFLPPVAATTAAGVSLTAWLLWALMLLAPSIGLALALRTGQE